MLAADDSAARVSVAADRVHQALSAWDAANLSRCAQCRELLHAAVAELTVVDPGKRLPKSVAKPLNQLRTDVQLLSRLVDAASSFNRGMTVYTGGGESALLESAGQSANQRLA
jgi:hypothetical protein